MFKNDRLIVKELAYSDNNNNSNEFWTQVEVRMHIDAMRAA